MGSTTIERSPSAAVAATPVDSLPLSNRTRSRLLAASITTLDQLMRVSDEELLALRGFGHVCLREVRTILRVVHSPHGTVEADAEPAPEHFPTGIDDPLSNTPIERLPIPNRARRVFQREGIKSVGDYLAAGEAHLLKLRNFGVTSLSAVNRAINAASRSTRRDASTLRRFQNSEAVTARAELEQELARVPVAALDLPRRARRACQEMGLRTLHDLAQISGDDLLMRRNFGQATLRRIQREVERFLLDHETSRPTGFLGTIEQLLGRLQDKERRLVELREGRDGEPMTLTEAGRSMEITESRACQIEHAAWHKLRRFAAGATDEAAKRAVALLLEHGGVAHSQHLLQDEYFSGEGLNAAFLGRILARLVPHRVTRLADGRLAAAPAATLFTVAARLRKRLRRNHDSQPLDRLAAEVLRGLDVGEEGRSLVQALCEVLFHREVVLDADGTALVRTPVQGLGDDLRRVLECAGKPMHFRDIARQLAAPPYSRSDLDAEKVRLRLCRDSRFVLVRRGLYDLVERFQVAPELRARVAEHAFALLSGSKRPTSVALLSAELRRQPGMEGVSEFVLAAVLRRDARFHHIGRGTFVTQDRSDTDVHHVSEILETILREAGGPLSYAELRRRVQERRSVSDGAISATLVGRRTFLRVARGRFDLAERYPFDDACRQAIAAAARERIEAAGSVAALDQVTLELPLAVTRQPLSGVLLGDLLRRHGGFQSLPGGFVHVDDPACRRALVDRALAALRDEQEPLRPTTIARRLALNDGALALLRESLKQDPRFTSLPDGRVRLTNNTAEASPLDTRACVNGSRPAD